MKASISYLLEALGLASALAAAMTTPHFLEKEILLEALLSIHFPLKLDAKAIPFFFERDNLLAVGSFEIVAEAMETSCVETPHRME